MQDGTPKQAKLPPDVVATITALREQRTELSDAVISWRAAYLIRDADAKNLEKAVGDKVRELEAAREEIKKLQAELDYAAYKCELDEYAATSHKPLISPYCVAGSDLVGPGFLLPCVMAQGGPQQSKHTAAAGTSTCSLRRRGP